MVFLGRKVGDEIVILFFLGKEELIVVVDVRVLVVPFFLMVYAKEY